MSTVPESPNAKRDVLISKSLSKLLRHKAISENLPIDSNGYIPIAQLLNHHDLKSKRATFDDIKRIVDSNDKKRFKLSTDESKICALQGHSIKNIQETPGMLKLNNVEDWPQFLIHGTYRDKLPLIQKTGGISKMKRNHIHFTSLVPQKFKQAAGVDSNSPVPISGVRASCNVLIFFNVAKLMSSKLHFYKSENDVYLSPGNDDGIVGTGYILKVIDRDHGQIKFP